MMIALVTELILKKSVKMPKKQAAARLATFSKQQPEIATNLPPADRFVFPSMNFAFVVKVSLCPPVIPSKL